MRANSIFIGLLSCPPGHHDAFLDRHEQDHRPENHGCIEHIYHSARFVAPPESLAWREAAAEGPFSDAGQYVMTYWSSQAPERLLEDMTVLREQLAAIGRCEPINRDFHAVWRDRMQLAKAYANPRHLASPDAAPFAPHASVVVTVGVYADDSRAWARWYDHEAVPTLFEDEQFTAAFTLLPMDLTARSLFVHLHYSLGPPAGAQAGVRELLALEPGPEIQFRGVYVPQHAGQPRFYE